jgi:hypothetical protein
MIIIIAPSNTQTTTDIASDAESAISPAVIGVVVTVTVLMASLVTLLVIIAIIRKKTANRNTHDVNMQDNDVCSLKHVMTEAKPAYGRHGNMPITTNIPTSSDETDLKLSLNEAYIPTHIPVEANRCYVTADPDRLYATVEENTNITTSQQETADEYDYVENNL